MYNAVLEGTINRPAKSRTISWISMGEQNNAREDK